MSALRCKKIRTVLEKIATENGWADYSYTFVKSIDWSNPSGIYVRESSPRWEKFLLQYKDSGIHYFHAPLLMTDLPKIYDYSTFATCTQGTTLSALLLSNGWQSGLAYPTFGYGGVMGLVALLHKELKVAPEVIKSTISELDIWRGQFNAWSRELVESRRPKTSKEALSQREMDCMALVAEGKTSHEIADTLGITKRTVDFHINNAIVKLGCTSRSQAALMLFLSPMPQMDMLSKFK